MAERTTAVHSISRAPVALDFAATDVIATRYEALRFGNVNGHDIFIYPGFALMRDNSGDFALIDLQELEVTCRITPFHEEETVPHDAETIGYTWKKANKDGSQDLRFANNYQIPVMRYGQIDIRSGTGINERYMLSNAKTVFVFGQVYQEYQGALKAVAKGSKPPDLALPSPEYEKPPLLPRFSPRARAAPVPSIKDLIPDFATTALFLLAMGYGAWQFQHRPTVTTAMPAETMDTRPAPGSAVPAPPGLAAEPSAVRIVKAQSANVRAAPSKTAEVVATVQSGARLSVFGTDGEWVRIGDKQPTGWIHQSLLKE